MIGTKEPWDYSERRTKLRSRCRFEASAIVGQAMMGCEIKNISVDGVQILSSGKIKPGVRLELRGLKKYDDVKLQAVQCNVRWSKKHSDGWLVGAKFLTTIEDLNQSWLFWELKARGVRVVGMDQRRSTARVKCDLPGRLMSKDQKLEAKIANLGPKGAMVQTIGDVMAKGDKVALVIGPHGALPKVVAKGRIAHLPVEGVPSYGIEFLEFDGEGEEVLRAYLDHLFKPSS